MMSKNMKKIFARNFLLVLVLASVTDSVAAERRERSCTRRAAALLMTYLGLTSAMSCITVPTGFSDKTVDLMPELPAESRVRKVCNATLHEACGGKPRCYASELDTRVRACGKLQDWLNFAHDHGVRLDTQLSEGDLRLCGYATAAEHTDEMHNVIGRILPRARPRARNLEFEYIYATTKRLQEGSRQRRGVTGDDELPLLLEY
jgi:hypothetical protein